MSRVLFRLPPGLVWRDGRPRWVASPSLRARGWRGKDLRSSGGEWMRLEEAIEAAKLINHDLVKIPPPPRKPRASASGYIYFLRAGGFIKIGYSKEPLRRLSEIKTGLAEGYQCFVVVPGRNADERALHAQLAKHRTSGEWFTAAPEVLQAMYRAMVLGAPSMQQSEPSFRPISPRNPIVSVCK